MRTFMNSIAAVLTAVCVAFVASFALSLARLRGKLDRLRGERPKLIEVKFPIRSMRRHGKRRAIQIPKRGIVPGGLILLPRDGRGRTGTLSIDDLRAVNFQSVVEFGMNQISEILARDLQVHQQLVADLLEPLAEITADRQRIAGTSARGEMVEADEFGRAPTQKVRPGTTVGFPLRMYQFAVGWTRKYLQNHTPAELVDQMTNAKKAHLITLARQIRRAVYLSANYTHRDFLVDNVELAVKRLVNADGAGIPDGPNGEVFDPATHTHYLGTANFVEADLKDAIGAVLEHGHGGQIRAVISLSDEAEIRALDGFKDYVDPRLTLNSNAREASTRLDITRIDNRAIGLIDAAEVWVKPWGIPGRIFVYDATSGNKPLVVRTRDGQAPTLQIAANIEMYPLQAEYMESEFGVGVWNRSNGAVLDMENAVYADPVIP